MPAAQLSRLRTQIATLALAFNEPAQFQSELTNLLELYADLTFHPGQAAAPSALMPAYHAPPLVVRQLELELGKLCAPFPASALAVVDLLREDMYLEPRMLGAYLLGQVPPRPAAAVLNRIQEWILRAGQPREVLAVLLDQGSCSLQNECPQEWLGLIEQWLAANNPALQRTAVSALAALVPNREFENLPAVYKLLSPLLRNLPPGLMPELQTLLTSLARRSPGETAFYLKQLLAVGPNPGLSSLVRRCLSAFPPSVQAGLRTQLQNRPVD
jgi:hypothetical protein